MRERLESVLFRILKRQRDYGADGIETALRLSRWLHWLETKSRKVGGHFRVHEDVWVSSNCEEGEFSVVIAEKIEKIRAIVVPMEYKVVHVRDI